MRAALSGLAAGAPVPVFPVAARGGVEAVQDLACDGRLRLVDTPRAANVLLVAGEVTRPLLRPVVLVHDQVSHPRRTVWWPLGAATRRLARLFPRMVVVEPDSAAADVVDTIVRVHRELLRATRSSEAAVLPDVDPAPWRGVGPYGQGGKGMTGGVPYGRPMAGRAPDRDGLELDRLEVRVGPFFPPFPPGLVLDVKLQGDVLQEVAVGENPFRRPRRGSRRGRGREDLFRSALRGPVPIAALELARARHHLRWLAHMLRVHGLDALGLRALRLVRDLTARSVPELHRLHRLLERTRALGWATAGVGILEGGAAHAAGGPVARAAGVAEDARVEDPGYRALGFEPVVQEAGDARARWRQRLGEAMQSLELVARAGDRRTEFPARVESPRETLTAAGSSSTAALLEALPALLTELEWGDAVTVVVSLDLDLEEGAG